MLLYVSQLSVKLIVFNFYFPSAFLFLVLASSCSFSSCLLRNVWYEFLTAYAYLSLQLPFVTTTFRYNYLSLQLPFVTTTFRYNYLSLQLPFVTTTFCYNYLSLQLPFVTTTFRYNYLVSSTRKSYKLFCCFIIKV